MLKMGSNKRFNGFSNTEHRSKLSRDDSDNGFSTGLAHLEPQAQRGLRENNLKSNEQHQLHLQEPLHTEIDDSLNTQLLVATVMGDEQDFKTISPENFVKLKQEQAMIETRVRAVQQKLMMESKLQGATQSLQRLQDERPLHHADAERYDHLIAELSKLQERSKEIQISILKHTVKALKNSYSSNIIDQKNSPDNEDGREIGNKDILRKNHGLTDFDSRSLYQLPDDLNFIGKNQGRATNGHGGLHSDREFEEVKERLSGLNQKLQKLVDDISQKAGYSSSQNRLTNGADALSTSDNPMGIQLENLEKGLEDISQVQKGALKDLRSTQALIETRLDRMASLANDTISIQWEESGRTAPSPVRPITRSPEADLEYLEQSIAMISEEKREMARSLKSIRATSEQGRNLKDTETVLAGLWDILKSDDEISGLTGDSKHNGEDKSFSLQAFSTKVQNLFNQATQQAEQHSVLRRQIEQQRELNAKADEGKNARIAELNLKIADLETSNSRQSALETDLNSFQATLDSLKKENAEQMKLLLSTETAKKEAEISLQNISSKYKAAEAEREHFESQVVRLQTELTIARAELDASGATRSQQAAQAAAENATQQQLKALMNQCDSLRSEAISARKERDEVKLNATNIDRLRTELKETLTDLEELTKAGVEAERERETLEHAMDSLRDRCEELETRLAEEKISGLDVRSPKSGGATVAPNGESTSTIVLKAEFKRLMREARAEGFKALKVSSSPLSLFIYCTSVS